MKFKLLHVRPHVWFFKQKDAIASGDESSSEVPYVYKRSTSLKLVKSDPSVSPVERHSQPVHAPNPDLQPQNCRKDVRVCTVVDAGCTCRATVSSDHKQKKGLAMAIRANGDSSSLHDVCRPRWVQVREKGGGSMQEAACRSRRGQLPNQKHAAASSSASSAPAAAGVSSSSVVSRLACKSSQDAVSMHSSARTADYSGYGNLQIDSRSSLRREDDAVEAASMDVHELECRLRNAGLEKRRLRRSEKINYFDEAGPSLISSGISANHTANTNSDTLITPTAMENHSLLSVEDLRASIAQRKLAHHQASAGSVVQNVAANMSEEVTEKHIDVGVSKKLFFSEYNAIASHGGSRSRRSSTHNELGYGEIWRSPTSMVEACIQKRLASHSTELKEAIASNRAKSSFPKGEVPHKDQITEAMEACVQKRLAAHSTELKEAAIATNRAKSSFPKGEVPDKDQITEAMEACIQTRLAAHGELKEAIAANRARSSFPKGEVPDKDQITEAMEPCIIQTRLAAHSTEQKEAAIATNRAKSSFPKRKVPNKDQEQMITEAMEAEEAHESLQESDRSLDEDFMMVKSSYDPARDFKASMLEMVVAKQLRQPQQMQRLLQCYLSLNPSHYHPTIIKVFHELCSDLFS